MPVSKKYISVPFSESSLKQGGLSFLVEMSNLLSIPMSPEDLLSEALARVLEYFNLEAGRIYLLDDEGEYLHLAAHRGLEPKGFEKISINEGFSGKAARTRSFIAQHVSELEDEERSAFLLSKGFQIVICVPLIVRDKVMGVLNLASTRIVELDKTDIDLLVTLGNQMAVAVDNEMLYQDLTNKIRTLKEKKEMIKYFAYSISHDLKSPAVGIYGLTKRLQQMYGQVLDEKGKAYCDRILETADQLVALVGKINTYIATREVPLHFEHVKVKEVAETIRNEFSDVLSQRQIDWSEPEILPEITADKLALTRVFRNLVDNALKYGGDRLLEIRMGYEEDKAFHIFSISDDGVGITKEDKEKIFEMFQRNGTSKGTAGAGLGLPIIKEIAERHGGNAWVNSSLNDETTFCISISKEL